MRDTIALRPLKVLAVLALAGWLRPLAAAPDDNLLSHTLQATNADAAWSELAQSAHVPDHPTAWQTMSEAEQKAFFIPYLAAWEDRSKDFYTRFPKDGRAQFARIQEYNLAFQGIELGGTNQQARMEDVEKTLLNDPQFPEKQRFTLRENQIMRVAEAKESEGQAAYMAEFEKGIRVLQKEFSNQPEVMRLLFMVASSSDSDKARQLAKEVVGSNAPDEVKEEAASLLKQLESVGKPVELQFTAVDGREVDLTKMKGKVVLVDFWATWCPPCVREVPHVKAAYDKFHAKGFEVVGVSMDHEQASLTRFVAEHKMEWPQYLESQGQPNRFALQFGIGPIPAMWLIDKQGNLRDVNGRTDLGGKVEKLLAE